MPATTPAIPTPTLYRLRVKEGAPFDNVSVGGQTFAKQTERVDFTDEGRTIRIPIAGQIVPMLPAAVEKVRAAIARKRVRWQSKKAMRAAVIDVVSGPNVEQPADEPLSKWVAIEETDEIASAL